jgi:hypothetical protein
MDVQLPSGYVDRHPERGPWISPECPPEPWADVSVLLPGGSTEPATWTGRLWWRDRELHPLAWRRYSTGHREPVNTSS